MPLFCRRWLRGPDSELLRLHAPAAAPSMSIIAQHPMIDQIALVTGCGAAEAIGFAVARCMETARGHAVTFLPSPPLHRMTSSH